MADDLRRSRRRLEDLRYALDQAAIVAETDRRGTILAVNDRFCEISGYDAAELVGNDHRIVNSGHHPKAFFREMWATIGRGRVWRGEIRNRRKDGDTYWVDTTIVPLLDDDGRPVRYLAIRSDITERKRAEAELRETAALKRLGEMAAVVAHEVRNPLAGITGALQILGRRMPDVGGDRDVVDSILDRVKVLDARLEELLRYARPTPPLLRRAPVQGLVERTLVLLTTDPAMRDVRLERDVAPGDLWCDPDRIGDAITNVVLNAVEAVGRRGTIAITGRIVDERYRLSIRDDGPGVDPEIAERIFEPFFGRRPGGTGLGLAVARQVLRAHGGDVELGEPEGGGAEFVLRLPLAPV